MFLMIHPAGRAARPRGQKNSLPDGSASLRRGSPVREAEVKRGLDDEEGAQQIGAAAITGERGDGVEDGKDGREQIHGDPFIAGMVTRPS